MIFDGHNDVLSKMYRESGPHSIDSFVIGRSGAVDLPKAVSGGFGGGLFAVYVPSPSSGIDNHSKMNVPSYEMALPEMLVTADAELVAHSQIAILTGLQDRGALEICTTTKQLNNCFGGNKLAAVMHMEGADAIDVDLAALDGYYSAGLRSLGLVWSRPTMFGHGVPFKFPSDGNIGPGLSDHGQRLVHRCNQLGVMIDLSHLNETGFWDVAKLSNAPLVATHSNAHSLCPSSRNLTDCQLAAIADSDGLVGLNFSAAFLRADGQRDGNVSLEPILRHLDHLIDILGEDRVGFGSDYDGAVVPDEISSIAELPRLRQKLRAHGYDEPLLEKLCFRNWFRVLELTWGE